MYLAVYLSLIIFCSFPGWAHDIEHTIQETKAIAITVYYDGGEPMSYAEVTLYSPLDETVDFQNGRTDSNGCFTFIPDRPGDWKIVVNDGMGHGLVTTIPVQEGMKVDIIQSGNPRLLKLVTGLSAFLGMSGLLFYWRARRATAGSNGR